MPRIIGADTETFRFGEQPDGTFVVIPTMICTSWAVRNAEGIETHLVSDGDGDAMRELWRGWLKSHDILVFQNAAYDLGVCCVTYPELEPLVWAKLERGEITCTKIREKLLNLSTHGNLDYLKMPDETNVALGYGLADLALKYLGIDISDAKNSDDSPRTQYDLYTGMPSKSYPVDARNYALQDAHMPLAIYEAQTNARKSDHGHASFHTEFFQTACDFALFLTTAQGIPVDPERFEVLRKLMEETLHEDNLQPLIGAGILRPAEPTRPHTTQLKKALKILADEFGLDAAPSWSNVTDDQLAVLEAEGIKFVAPKKASKDAKKLAARVEAICKTVGVKPKRTKTGGISTDSEVIEDLMAFDTHDVPPPEGLPEDDPRGMTPLANYHYRQAVQKIVTTELPRMTWGNPPKAAERVYFPFAVLKATGRTSSFTSKHYPSGNGQQVDPRGRPCYLPEEGCVLLSTDYSALELCSVAQTTYDLFGSSEHRNKINAGMDLHANLASGLATRLPSPFSGGYKDFVALKAMEPKFYKHWRKFAKPVGLGYPGGLGANTFMSLAKKTYGVDVMAAAQDIDVAHLPGPENTTVCWHAKRVGITPENWTWTPFLRGIALSVLLKQVWLETYPEMVAYFQWVTQQIDPHNKYVNQEGNEEDMLCYTTPMGMHRAGGTFTAIANGKAMQSPAAEGAKTAVFRLQHEIRLGRLRGLAVLHNFIHDEFLLSVRRETVAEAVAIVEEIAIDSMQNIMPDVRISVESALMERWEKFAEPVRERGTMRLMPWVNGVEYDIDPDGSLWIPTAT